MVNNIKYYPQVYVGMREESARDDDGNEFTRNLGFLTPYGTNQAAKNRIASVETWASNYLWRWDPQTGKNYQATQIPSQIFDNNPISGFKIERMVRRYETSNVLWRLTDPRGFELELASDGLDYIIGETGILKGGEIPARCVWGRTGAKNWLVPEGSKEWAFLNVDMLAQP